uniref:Zgc:154046 n=1 Tax=Sinocyclocheilus grahami TaxID=75366 RepID=A0A672SX42_SINGR
MVKPCRLLSPLPVVQISERPLVHQESLPKLPVPPLQQTCVRYLASLEPLICEEEMTHTHKLMDEFLRPGGVGERLQKSLERRARKTENWLTDWWMQSSYLDSRMPVAMYTSPGVVLPKMHLQDRQGQMSIEDNVCLKYITIQVCLHYHCPLYTTLQNVWDKTNKESVRAIQKSIFTVCLDAPKPRVSDEMYFNKVAAQMLHGGGSRWNSGNRWFDKTLQFIIGEDGSCGLTYEHAPAEGPPIVFLVDHVVDYMKRSEMVRTPMIPLSMPQKLRFNITPEIKKDIEKAKQNMNIMVHDLDVRVLNFTHYGRKFPKSHKMSPDAFIQMALQLAYYRMYQTCCPTYESTSLRMFKLGRTEAIRSTTTESLQFTKAMDDPSKHNSEKAALLEKAIKVHRKHTHMAIHGQGIERHMLGLKMIAIEDLTSLPEIFMDTSFAVASHFNLYTSQVGSKTDCVMCLGPMVPDGYGICYNPMDDHINFAVTAFNSCEETNATKLSQFLEDSLLDMKTLLEQVSKTQ